ncbi:MAG: hypothetical protein HYS12_18095 [Planctomycetes bacterium]|nr:hypothetical protein [Planctomycetota bacterium]
MLRFRSSLPASPVPLSDDSVRRLAEAVLAPGHFFTGSGVGLEGEHDAEQETAWEVFRGRLVDRAHTRQTQTFEAWDIYLVDDSGRSGEPLLSLKFDRAGDRLHVVRGLLCYVWEGYDAGGNVYLSRETTRWVRELTGTISLGHFATESDLLDELVCRLFQAVVGASRLPLTSVEAPLPGFSFGRLAYFYRPGPRLDRPARSWAELLESMRGAGLGGTEQAKLLETLLHATSPNEMADLATRLAQQEGPALLRLLRTLFNEVSLSPWTDLVDKTLSLLDELERQGHVTAEQAVDFLGGLIRQIGRHLTAYDLVTFHHRGANYPDALLLDAALKALLSRLESHSELFDDATEDGGEVRDRKRLCRRALRQGWLLRRFYEGHPVPDAPTSPGESMRVLPLPHVRVPEEQILQPSKRTRHLFAGDPLANHLGPHGEETLRQGLRDLHHPQELLELGLALFLDRPLGAGKGPGEADQTVLLSHLAFSRSIALRRLKFLGETGLVAPAAVGVPLSAVGGRARPGAVSVADARQVADDFVFLRTTASSARDFFRQYDFGPLFSRFRLEDIAEGRTMLILPLAEGRLVVHDAAMRRRLELLPDVSQGYASRAGNEYLTAGLQVLRVGEETDRPGELREHDLSVPVRVLPATP